MQYLGGKSKIAKKLVEFLEKNRKKDQLYVEPFLGGCNILPLISGKRIGAEINQDLVMLYNAVQNGWLPPTSISENEYKELKNAKSSALRGFAGVACSFSGKWFGGYARSGDRNYALNGYNGLKKMAIKIEDATIINSSYEQLEIPDGSMVYCDPPYANTTEYKNKFDTEAFWRWARKLSKSCDVYISEYTAPNDFECVWELERNLEMCKNGRKRIEKLFKYRARELEPSEELTKEDS